MTNLGRIATEGVSSGYLCIDSRTKGFAPGELIVVAASRPEMGAHVFASAFWMALPLTVLLLLANLALGIMSRVAPQMNIYAIGFPVTLATGLGGLALILPLMDRSLLALLELALDKMWLIR